MPEAQEPAPEAIGPTCLYKDGEAVTFEGADVAIAMGEGWTDSPNGPPPALSDPVPTNKPPSEPKTPVNEPEAKAEPEVVGGKRTPDGG